MNATLYKILFFGFLGLGLSTIKIPSRHHEPPPAPPPPKRQCTSLLTVERPDSAWFETLCTGGAKPWDSVSWKAPRPEP